MALNEARTTVGKCLNAAMPVNEANDYAPGEIIFTGGGSQADNLAIRGFMHGPTAKGRKHLITSKIEHQMCIRDSRKGFHLGGLLRGHRVALRLADAELHVVPCLVQAGEGRLVHLERLGRVAVSYTHLDVYKRQG